LSAHDPRLAAFRPDLADVRLRGQVEAARFVPGTPARIAASVADVRRMPRLDAGLDTQFLMGTTISVFDEAEGFSWVQSDRDRYVGYVASADLGPADAVPTHRVIAPRSFVYSGPDLRLPRRAALSMGAEVEIVGQAETRGTVYAVTRSGEAIIAGHLEDIGGIAADYVAVAETLIHTPYLWGRHVGLRHRLLGPRPAGDAHGGPRTCRAIPTCRRRDLGMPLEPGPDFTGLARGDLVFWKGHVAIMTDPRTMIHANGHTMMVSREGLSDAIGRIGYLYGGPTSFRRP
jgi:cell wall-associated NlpC family hydrolase